MLSFGPRHEPPGGYAGAKIAFGRIPDRQDF
jgi:DNA polymerase IV